MLEAFCCSDLKTAIKVEMKYFDAAALMESFSFISMIKGAGSF